MPQIEHIIAILKLVLGLLNWKVQISSREVIGHTSTSELLWFRLPFPQATVENAIVQGHDFWDGTLIKVITKCYSSPKTTYIFWALFQFLWKLWYQCFCYRQPIITKIPPSTVLLHHFQCYGIRAQYNSWCYFHSTHAHVHQRRNGVVTFEERIVD